MFIPPLVSIIVDGNKTKLALESNTQYSATYTVDPADLRDGGVTFSILTEDGPYTYRFSLDCPAAWITKASLHIDAVLFRYRGPGLKYDWIKPVPPTPAPTAPPVHT